MDVNIMETERETEREREREKNGRKPQMAEIDKGNTLGSIT